MTTTLAQASAIPLFPHEAVGSFIGLLLAFRTSQSYDRFWEARTIWDGVYSSIRSITRLACVPEQSSPEPQTTCTDQRSATWDCSLRTAREQSSTHSRARAQWRRGQCPDSCGCGGAASGAALGDADEADTTRAEAIVGL